MKKVLLFFCFLQVAVLFLFYPYFYGIYDEDIYLTTTYALQKGSFFYEEADVPAPLSGIIDGHRGSFSQYPPGNSILLLPFTSIHWRLGFLKNILLYIGSFLLFVLILRRFNIDPIYSLFFLFHPTLVLFSRTLMSDIPSMFFLLLGIFLLLNKKNVAAGFSLGFLLLLRYPNLIIILGILAVLLYKKEYKKALLLFPGVIFFSLILLIYILYAFGSFLGPFSFGEKFFSVRYFLYNFPYYFISFNILYPGLLVGIMIFEIRNKRFSLFVIPALILIVFYSFYFYIDRGNNFIEKLIKGQRFLIPIIPFILIPYLDFLHNKKLIRKVFIFVVSLLFVLNCGIQYKHQQLLKDRNRLCEILNNETEGSNILICNKDADKLLNPYLNKAKLIELSGIKEYCLDSLKNNYNISFVFVEIDRRKDLDEKSQWVEYFKREKFIISYESGDPIPIIIMTE